YKWDNAAFNWATGGTSATYAGGANLTDVVFTDNVAANTGTFIETQATAQTPRSMTFTHIAGSTPTNYTFLAGSEFQNSSGGNSSGATMFGGSAVGSLLLDTGFLGTV